MFKMIMSWFSENTDINLPIVSLDDIIEMINNKQSFRCIVDREVYNTLYHTQRDTNSRLNNRMSHDYCQYVYYDGVMHQLDDINVDDYLDLCFPEYEVRNKGDM